MWIHSLFAHSVCWPLRVSASSKADLADKMPCYFQQLSALLPDFKAETSREDVAILHDRHPPFQTQQLKNGALLPSRVIAVFLYR